MNWEDNLEGISHFERSYFSGLLGFGQFQGTFLLKKRIGYA